jgi:hypothetical protein
MKIFTLQSVVIDEFGSMAVKSMSKDGPPTSFECDVTIHVGNNSEIVALTRNVNESC